uniref:Uncharacterized protein n=1 Tax=Romanomermis culicivorax TaxID=13658 RepID=A0A915HRL6_ROMCU
MNTIRVRIHSIHRFELQSKRCTVMDFGDTNIVFKHQPFTCRVVDHQSPCTVHSAKIAKLTRLNLHRPFIFSFFARNCTRANVSAGVFAVHAVQD